MFNKYIKMKIKNTKYFKDFCYDIGLNEVFSKNNNSKMVDQKTEQPSLKNKPKNKIQKLEDLKKIILESDCSLKRSATNMVFSSGNPMSEIMVIGEAPGSEEDRTSIPFVGAAGKLLDQMLNSINLKRDNDYYVTNVIFWRPPGNRTPNKDEIEICLPFVRKHIEIIDPKLIILLGNVAIKSLLSTNKGVTEVRREKNFILVNGKRINCFAMFHPAFLLRNSNMKKDSWIDLCKISKWINDRR